MVMRCEFAAKRLGNPGACGEFRIALPTLDIGDAGLGSAGKPREFVLAKICGDARFTNLSAIGDSTIKLEDLDFFGRTLFPRRQMSLPLIDAPAALASGEPV